MALYACPDCKDEDNLLIAVDTLELLLQTDNDEFETEAVPSDHYWDRHSYMTCRKCRWSGRVDDALKCNFKEKQNGSSS